MSESSSEEAEPQTPPRYPKRQPQHGDTSPTLSSPPASPSLSFHSLGRSPFSPLRHQIPPSSAQSAQSVAETQADVAEDSKDVLIQRLHDLVAKLSTQDEVQASSVDVMHSKMDELEQALQSDLGRKQWRHRRNHSSLDSKAGSLDLSSTEARPSLRLKSHLSEMVLPSPTPKSSENDGEIADSPAGSTTKTSAADTNQARHVLAQAKELQGALETVIKNLRERQEEQEHIHDLLITRAERAAQYIIFLEERVTELENERKESDMEVLNLQIQLKAIEVQCLSYIPRDVDPDLIQSINTWKTEWSALKKKRAHKKAAEPAEQQSPSPRISRRQLLLRSQTAG